MTDAEWYSKSNEGARMELARALTNPAVEAAFEHLVMGHLPMRTGDAQDGASKLAYTALSHDYLAGFHDFHRKLRLLARPLTLEVLAPEPEMPALKEEEEEGAV